MQWPISVRERKRMRPARGSSELSNSIVYQGCSSIETLNVPARHEIKDMDPTVYFSPPDNADGHLLTNQSFRAYFTRRLMGMGAFWGDRFPF